MLNVEVRQSLPMNTGLLVRHLFYWCLTMAVRLLRLQYFLMQLSRNGQSHKRDIEIDTVTPIRKWWRDTLNVRFQFLKLLIQERKFGNLRVSIGLEKIGVNLNVDHGINNVQKHSSDLLRNWRSSLVKALWLKNKPRDEILSILSGYRYNCVLPTKHIRWLNSSLLLVVWFLP